MLDMTMEGCRIVLGLRETLCLLICDVRYQSMSCIKRVSATRGIAGKKSLQQKGQGFAVKLRDCDVM
jgi:hypothetical protein